MAKNSRRVVPIADSFVVPSNKLATSSGNGEAKLYVGQRADYKVAAFWGSPGSRVEVSFSKEELISFIDFESHRVREDASQWRGGRDLAGLYAERRASLAALSSNITVPLIDDVTVGGPRRYLRLDMGGVDQKNTRQQSGEDLFKLIFRSIPLSGTKTNAACLVFEKTGDAKYRAAFSAGTHDEVIGMIERAEGDDEEARILVDPVLSPTTRRALIDSRIGQGAFKEALRRLDGVSCALTGVAEKSLLIASHIKSWAKSNDSERLDPHNGLLLSPDADKLFDLGLISFDDKGRMLVSSRLDEDDLRKCGIDRDMALKVEVNEPRARYLSFHRKSHGFD